MRELGFAIVGARPLTHAVAPCLALELAITNPSATPIHSAMLHCQVMIEPGARPYPDDDRERLVEIFGAGAPPRALLWAHTSLVVPGFDRETTLDLVLPCPIDFSHAAAKYFDGVRSGELPIVVQFGGVVFYAASSDLGGGIQVAPIAKTREARHRMSVEIWRSTVRHYFPDAAPLTLERDVLDRLHAYRRAQGLATCDRAIDRLLGHGPSGPLREPS